MPPWKALKYKPLVVHHVCKCKYLATLLSAAALSGQIQMSRYDPLVIPQKPYLLIFEAATSERSIFVVILIGNLVACVAQEQSSCWYRDTHNTDRLAKHGVVQAHPQRICRGLLRINESVGCIGGSRVTGFILSYFKSQALLVVACKRYVVRQTEYEGVCGRT